MDEMKIQSPFLRGIVSKLFGKIFKSKTGIDADVKLNDLKCSVLDDKALVHLDIYAEMSKPEFEKLMKKLGL